MDCANLCTAAEVLEAFQACNDVGEEIELFECLATRSEPPVAVFIELIEKIKLEPILALTIQAFGKITNDDIKARLKQSDDLLEMLSRQAQSGSTDLIRWAAATAIEKVGFDFVAVSQHLSQEPKQIAAKINESKIKKLSDTDLVNSSDYDEFIRFWAYGSVSVLRGNAVKVQRENTHHTILDVVNTQKLRGIKEVRDNLRAAEFLSVKRESTEQSVTYAGLMDEIIESAENELFEKVGQYLSARWLSQLNQIIESKRDYAFELFMEVQLHCLQSNNSKIRQQAATTILDIGNNTSDFTFLDHLKQEKPVLAIAVLTFSLDYGSTNYIYLELEEMRENLMLLTQELARRKVRQDCQDWLNSILKELDASKERLETRRQQSVNLRTQLNKYLSQIRDANPELYEQVFTKTHFDSVPQLSLKDEKYSVILVEYEQSLRDKALKLSREVNDFYTKLKSSQLEPLNVNVKNAKIGLKKVEEIEENIFSICYIAPFFLLLLVMPWIWAIMITFFFAGPISLIVGKDIVRNMKSAAKETLNKAEDKENSERYKLDGEKQKILNLLQL